MDLDLAGRTVIVTGASGGIGEATALRLADEGADLVLGARRPEPLEAVADQARARGARVETVTGDLTEPDAIAALVAVAADRFGTVHGLAACVGSTPIGTFAELTDQHWVQAFETKFLATVRVVRATLPLMSTGARVVLVAGNAAHVPSAHMATSSAINAALGNLAVCLSLEHAAADIGFVALDPGVVATQRMAGLEAHLSASRGIEPDEVRAQLLASIPRHQVARADEVGALATLLLSPLAAHVTATSLVVDGGQAAQR